MLGEVVKFIMTIVGVIQWFFKARPQIVESSHQDQKSKSRVFSQAEQRHWRGYVLNNECKRFIGKNPAYKSSNGF